MSQHKEKILKISGVLVLVTITVLALVKYPSILDKQLREQIKTNLKDISAQNVFILQQEVMDQMSSLMEIAARIGDSQQIDYEDAARILREVVDRHPFKRMGIADREGNAHTTDEVAMNISSRRYFQKSLQGETAVSQRLMDYADGEAIVVFSTPVYQEGETAAVLFATYDIHEFARILTHASSAEAGGFCVVREDGDIIVSDIFSMEEGPQNIYQALAGVRDEDAQVLTQISQALENGRSGGVHIHGKEDRYLQISSIDVNDWYLINFIPSSVMDETRTRIMGLTYILCLGIGLMIAAFVFTLFWLERKRYRELEHVLYVDPLTGGYSHQKFLMEARKKLDTAERKAAFLVMDIDRFKLVNEMFGQKEGDKTLCYLAECWQKWIRKDELFARRIADRFTVLAFYEDRDELIRRVEKFVNDVRQGNGDRLDGYVLTPRIGVYLIEDKTEDIQSIHNNAVIAHSDVKSNGSVAYGVFDQAFKEKTLQIKILEDQMEAAYRKNEFIAYYQPKFDARTGELAGAEALVRWQKPDGTLIPPGRFIPLAEKRGFVTKLDKLMFRQVCGQLRSWQEDGRELVPVSVNVSREHLKDSGFIQEYAAMMEKSGVSSHYLELELTESALFENMDVTRTMVEELHRQGIRVLMDDFGTGYSSLMMLKTIPIDVMKLDKSFVDDYNDPRGEKIIECVIGLSRALDIKVTAEGVETREQYEFLRDLGCDCIQGFYFARPMPPEEFGRLLKQRLKKPFPAQESSVPEGQIPLG